jgi:hypothetical protein
MQNIAHWKPGGVIPGFCFSNFIKTQKSIHLMSCKKLMQFDLRTIEEHTGCIPWILRTPYSVKLFSSLLLTEAFRNPRICGKPWSTQKRYSFLQRFSGVQESTHFSHTQSVQLKAMPQWLQGLNIHFKSQWIPNCTRKITHRHTDTQTHINCWYTVCYLVSEYLNFHLLNYNVEETRSHWTPGHPGALHQLPQSEWEVFFQGFLCIPIRWIYWVSVK